MAQKKNNIRTYINIADFKLNRISLLNQSKFSPSLNNVFANKNIDIVPDENYHKINPLAKKHKIVKKHNILKKIDFNINSYKTKLVKKNDNSNDDLSLVNVKENSPMNIFENKKLHLPILIYNNNNNYSKFLQNTRNFKNNRNRLNLQKNRSIKNTSSLSLNSFIQKNVMNNSNHIINNISKISKPNKTDKEIQTSDDLRTLNEEQKLGMNPNSLYKLNFKNKYHSKEMNDDDSSDNFEYKKEIEKILTNKPVMKNIGDFNIMMENNRKMNQSKYNNYIRLKSLYKVKSFKKNFNKTEHNAKIMSIRPKNIDKNLFNKIFISHNNKNYSQRQKQFDGIKNYGRKIIPKAYIYNLLNLYNNGKTDE